MYQYNENILLYKEVVYVVAYPSLTEFYKVALTMKIRVTSWHEIPINYFITSYLCKWPARDHNISD